jgi:hypothetical protein
MYHCFQDAAMGSTAGSPAAELLEPRRVAEDGNLLAVVG